MQNHVSRDATGARRPKVRSRRGFRPPLYLVEVCERRLLLSTISGTVFSDLNANGVMDPGEPGIAGRTVYIDLNNNGVLDPDRVINVAFPDLPQSVNGHPTGIGHAESNLTLSGVEGVIKDTNLTVNITHPVSSDLEIFLVSDFQSAEMAAREGLGTPRDGPNYTNTTFDDSAATPIGASSAPHTGTFRPEQSLAHLNGASLADGLSLQVLDETLLDDGTVNSASVRLVTGEPTAVTGADGSFTFVLPSLDPGEVFIRQIVPNTDSATLPTNNQAVAVNVPGNTSTIAGVTLGTTPLRSITGLVFDDINADGIRDTGEALLTNTTPFLDINDDGVRESYGSRAFNSIDVPRSISGVTAIDSGVNIAGSGLISDLNVTLKMSLDDNAPVSAFLISPRGRRVELFSGLSGQGFVQTTFDDQATTSITRGAAPYTGTFKPVGSLSDFSNEVPGGDWLLEIVDTLDRPNHGQLTSWSLRVTTAEPAASYSPTGNYFFQNLFPGSYSIGQEVPAGFLRLRPDSGEQDITFVPGGFTGSTNFAMQRGASISGKLFIDTNGNGVLNVGETGIPGQSIFLDQDNNLALAPLTTNTHSNGVDLPIPDGGKTASAITLSGIDPLQLITGVGVALSITHPADTDLSAFLISPSGTRVLLFAGVGGTGDNFTNTMFTDSATTAIAAGAPPFTGTFRPQGALSTFIGQNANGTWRLELNDAAVGNAGTLTNWTITVDTGEPLVLTDASGNYSFTGLRGGTYFPRDFQGVLGSNSGFFTTQLNGNQRTLVSGENLAGNDIGVAATITLAGQVFNDANANGKDPSDPPAAGRTVFVDLNNDGVPNPPATAAFSITENFALPDPGTIARSLNVSGVAGKILDLNVTLDITHSNDTDLTAVLMSPTSKRVLLFAHVGGTGNNFTNTTFSDQAATVITSGTAPFTGTFKPEGLLSDFNNDNPNGQWHLQITDGTATNSGTLVDWKLSFTVGEPTSVTNATGNFSIGGLAPGAYSLRQVVPAGTLTTFPAAGFYPITATSGSHQTGLDFGTGIPLPGDLNIDGTVNFTDLLTLAQHFGHSGLTRPDGDLDSNGSVNFTDLLILAQHFGQTTTPPAAAAESLLLRRMLLKVKPRLLP